MLIDCGEGAFAALQHVVGDEEAAALLQSLSCIWVSHHHADHCLGLTDVIGG